MDYGAPVIIINNTNISISHDNGNEMGSELLLPENSVMKYKTF